jgi:hypothetical protein
MRHSLAGCLLILGCDYKSLVAANFLSHEEAKKFSGFVFYMHRNHIPDIVILQETKCLEILSSTSIDQARCRSATSSSGLCCVALKRNIESRFDFFIYLCLKPLVDRWIRPLDI